jgi:hypothetical protein
VEGVSVFGLLARSAATVGIAGAMVFAMPMSAQAAMPLPNPGPLLYLVPAAAGTVTGLGAAATFILPEASLIATAALAGYGLGYGGAAAVNWAWDQAFNPEAGGATYPATAGHCNMYNMGVAGPPNTMGDTIGVRAYCAGALAGAEKLEPNTTGGFSYLFRVGSGTSAYWEGFMATSNAGAPTLFNVGGDWTGKAAFERDIDSNFIGVISLDGVTMDWLANLPPFHRLRAEADCPGGGTITSYSTQFTESDLTGPKVQIPVCGPGVVPTAVRVREGDGNGVGGTRGYNWTPAAAPAPADPLKGCYPGGAEAPCTLALVKVVGSGVQSCADGGVDCTSFNPATSGPEEYQCRWGSHVVTLNQCEALRTLQLTPGTPDPAPGGLVHPGTTTVTNPDGSIDTTEIIQLPDGTFRRVSTHNVRGTRTITTQQIDINGRPVGEPRIETVAPGEPVPIPSGPGVPGWGGGPNESADCWNTDGLVLWNPGAWVLRPIKCALIWAFVPNVASLDTDAIRVQLDRAGIGPSVAALSTAVGTMGGDAGGCSGPTINFNVATVHQAVTPFAACTEPMSTVAGYAYALTSVIVVIGGAGKIIACIGAGFGYGGPPPTWQQGTLF